MSDFSDRPLVAGSLIGLRAFGVDKLGRLTSIYHPAVFTPDVNEAVCRKSAYNSSGVMFGGPSLFGTGTNPRISFAPDPNNPGAMVGTVTYEETNSETATTEKKKPAHDVGKVSCTCGFYAYFDGANDYKDGAIRISGLIEGFGVCSVGDRGFRSSKARLVALIDPGKRFAPARLARVLHNYPDVPIYAKKREAIEAHPLTPPNCPTPETHEDFWTRPSS